MSCSVTYMLYVQLKRKAREAGDADVGVTLASEPLHSGEEEEEETAAQVIASGQQCGTSDEEDDAVYEGGLSSSDDDEEPQSHVKPGKAAYFGMQKRHADEDVAGKEYQGLSVAEQEALALRMIQR